AELVPGPTAHALRDAGPEMAESAVEGVTASSVERATGPARGLLRDRHGNGTGLGVLRDLGEQCFHRFLHRGGMPRWSGPGRARRRGVSPQSMSGVGSIVTGSPVRRMA